MRVEQAFDHAAKKYDEQFTNTAVGRLQRDRVWNYLSKNLSPKDHPRILELNCGTGEDAKWFASKGYKVVATDLSEEMIAVAKIKNFASRSITFEECAFSELSDKFTSNTFDVVFSDFGGLNCISEKEIRLLAENIQQLLKPNGRFIAVVMSDNCTLESWYFRRKKMYAESKRRQKPDGVSTTIEGETFTTYYYSPDKFRSMVSNVFTMKAQKAIGWAIPPSYTNPYFSQKPFLLKTLNVLENSIGNIPALAKKADHFLIDLVRK